MKRQTTPYSLAQYLDAGCMALTRDGKIDLIGAGIHVVTEGMPCNGCFMLQMNCPAFAKLSRAWTARAAPIQAGETVRQEAARLGISINEVRRRRT